MRRLGWLLVLGLIAWSGCFDQKALLKKLVPEADDRQARQLLELIRDGQMEPAREMLVGSLSQAEVSQGLDKLHELFTQSKWVEAETIGYNKRWTAAPAAQAGSTIQLDYQIRLEKHWLAGSVMILEQNGSRKILSVRFNPLTASLDTLYAFTLSGQSLGHYLVFLLCCLVPVFCVVALVVCIRSRVRRKWLWILFILLPVGKIWLNWSTGEWGAQLLAFQLLGASMFKMGLYAPWVLSVSFPLGAISFLLWRKSLLIPPANAPVPPPPVQ
jgi:hypothetical protein